MKIKIAHRDKRARRPVSAKSANARALRGVIGKQLYKRERPPAYVHVSSESVFALRQFLGLTQASFADQLGVRKLAVSWWETKRRSPNRAYAAKLRELAAMNNVEIDRLTNPKYFKSMRIRVFLEAKERVPRVVIIQSPSLEAMQI